MHDTRRFDEAAEGWDRVPRRVTLANAVAAAIVRHAGLPAAIEVLDFGCGTGLLTLALRPLVRGITGADTSAGMIQTLRDKVQAQELAGVDTVLLAPGVPVSLGRSFDLIVSSMTLHHVAEPAPLFRGLRELLRPGGGVALADLDTEDGSFHGEQADVHHLGFDRAAIAATLESSGFSDVATTTAAVTHKGGRDYSVFLLTGTRGA